MTRTEVYHNIDGALTDVNRMEDAGWSVHSITVIWESTLMVVFERVA